MGGIFRINDDKNELVEMTEQSYDSEDLLQILLAKYPNLLAGDQIDSKSPRRWFLITREASLPSEEGGSGRWSVDRLFLDQDGIPTIVEVKRSSDSFMEKKSISSDISTRFAEFYDSDSPRYELKQLKGESFITALRNLVSGIVSVPEISENG